MPYSKSDLKALPDSTKNLSIKQKEKFIEIFNALVKDGMEESKAIPLAIEGAKKVKLTKATTDQVERLPNGNLKYRGQEFPAYNKPIRDSGDKQGKVLAKKGSDIKIVRFGDPKLKDNYSVEANNAFYARFSGNSSIDDKFSPLYWSARWLWPKGSLKGKGPKPFDTLNKSTMVIKATNDEQMIAVDVVYEPNKPDAHGQWMSKETVRKACENFNKNLSEGNVKSNLFHIKETESFSILKSWINECDCYIGDKFVPEGTWLAESKYHTKELWDMKKSGELMGMSVGAKGVINAPKILNEGD